MATKNTLGDVIRIIAQDHGENKLLNAQFVLAAFMDLAPTLKKEKELLKAFLYCNGATKIVAIKSESHDIQEACINSIVRELEENQWLSKDAARYICSEFYKGLTNCEWVFGMEVKNTSHDLDVYRTATIVNPTKNTPISVSVEVDGKKVSIPVPNSITNGQTVRFPQKGRHDSVTGQTGDLYVTIHVHTDPSSNGKQAPNKTVYIAMAMIAVILLLFLFIPKNNSSSSVNPPATPQVHVPASTNSPAAQHQHDWKEATYNYPRTCITCGETDGSKKTPATRLHLADIIEDASASSIMSGSDEYRHNPQNLYDYDKQTNWTEGVSGDGVGEFVILRFNEIYAIKDITILIGSHYAKDSTYFQKNNRPSAISLTFSDGSFEYIWLEDTRDYQTIPFPEYHYTDYVKITIEDVYSGTHWDETIIAEVDFMAYNP